MATFAADNFNSLGAGTTLGGRTASDGGTWTDRDGASIVGDGAGAVESSNSAVDGGGMYHSGTPLTADYTVSSSIITDSAAKSGLGVAGRMDPAANTNYSFYYFQGNGWALWSNVTGGNVQLGGAVNTDLPQGAPKTQQLRMVGTNISGRVVGASNPLVSTTSSTITAAGKAGLYNYYADLGAQNLDSFEATDYVVTPTYFTDYSKFPITALRHENTRLPKEVP